MGKGIMVNLKSPRYLPAKSLNLSSFSETSSLIVSLSLSREELMASISTVGYLPNCSTFSIDAASSSSSASVGFISQRLVLQSKTKKPSVENPGRFRTSVVSRLTDPTVSLSDKGNAFGRREVFVSTIGFLAGAVWQARENGVAVASDFADMPAIRGKDYGKTKMRYPDYVETESGLQYKDLRLGNGPTPKMGEIVVVDWDGYTIGYYGRIFEARNKTKGGSFEGDEKEFFKFKLGSQQVIPAFEEAVAGMSIGGVRRIVVPSELGYPEYDYNKKGPQPTTFSGQRALDFVLKNQGLIDKTLLFDIELLKIVSN